MTSIDSHNRHWKRRARWPRRIAIGLMTVAILVIVIGWFRGQEQWGPFAGQLVDEETGAPITGANVMVSWDRRLPTLVGDGGRTFLDAVESVTDDEGRFELAGRPRYWELFATQPRFNYFAPGYMARGREIDPPAGVPFVDPTIVRMRPLDTWRCYELRRPSATVPSEAIPVLTRALQIATEECLAREGNEP